jgi:predicted aspartyl protease
VIGAGLAARLALPPGPDVTLHGTAGVSRVGTVKIDSLKIGSSELFGFTTPALPEEYLGSQGLLGIDALADQRLSLDFEHKSIVIQDSRLPERSIGNSDEIVVTARRRNGQLILTQASVGNTNLYAIIDSGTEISVGNEALRRRVVGTRRSSRTKTIDLISVTGQVATADLVVVPTLKLGGITFYNVPIAFADTPPFAVFGLAKQPALLLGTDVLQLFRRVSLDFRARKVRFVLKS